MENLQNNLLSSTNEWQRKRGREDIQSKRDSVLSVDLVWNPDSNKPTGEGQMFEKNQGN